MQRIGVGISTYKRLDTFEKTIKAVMQFTPKDVLIAIADDGSPLEISEAKMSMLWKAGGGEHKRIRFIRSEKNMGIAANKNKLVDFLLSSEAIDHVFLLEDDVRPVKEGWMDPFLKTSEVNQEGHLLYLPNLNYGTARHCTGPSDARIAWKPNCSGLLMYFRANLLRHVGGFDERFGKYSFEHNELSERSLIAQYHDPRLFPHCVQAEASQFIWADDTDGVWHKNSVYNTVEETRFVRINEPLYESLRREYIKQFDFAERQGLANSVEKRRRFL